MSVLRCPVSTGVLWLVLGLIAGGGTSVAAQSVEAVPAGMAPCRTTAGGDGLLFRGLYGMVYSPVDFAQARTEATGLTVIDALRDGPGVVAVGGSAPAPTDGEAPDEAVEAVVTFLSGDGQLVYSCAVQVVPFDASLNDLAQLRSGACDLKRVAGLPHLLAGHAQVLETPLALSEADIGPRSTADMSILSDRRLYLIGQAPGPTAVLWTAEAADGSMPVNLCPFVVESPGAVFGPGGPKDEDLCKDEAGAPIRLAVGQTARTGFRDDNGQLIEFQEGAVAEPAIVDLRFTDGGKGAMIEGLTPGSTSLTLLSYDATVAKNCEIVVR